MLRFGICLILCLIAGSYMFDAAASDIRREANVSIKESYSCFEINKVRLEENGLVLLRFSQTQHHKMRCKENILYDVSTRPTAQIRGAKGVNGRTPEKTFFIQVTPKTTKITLKLLKWGQVHSEGFLIEKSISNIRELLAAEKSMPSWQKAFQATESKLAETAAADKTPPTIRILSPVAASGQVPRVDTYTSFVRGQVTDEQGVMNILVNSKKSGH